MSYGCFGLGGLRIGHLGLDVDFDFVTGHIVLKIAVDKNSLRRDGNRRGFVEPDMAVNARPFIKPTFQLGRIHFHRNTVVTAKGRDVGNICAEGGVAALVTGHQPAIDPDGGIAKHAIEGNPNAFGGILLR